MRAVRGVDGSGLVIRHATPADAETLADISHSAYAEFRHRVRPRFQALSETPGHIRAEIDSLQSVYGLAVWRGRPVGHVRYQVRGALMLASRLAVLPDYRHRGIGKELMEWLEMEARRWELSKIRGEVRTAFPRLVRFYLRMGYRCVGYITVSGVRRCLTVIEKTVRPGDRLEPDGLTGLRAPQGTPEDLENAPERQVRETVLEREDRGLLDAGLLHPRLGQLLPRLWSPAPARASQADDQ